MFLHVSVILSTGGRAWLLRGAYMVAPGQGGMHGCYRGVCMVAPGGVRGCSWGAYMVAPGGVHGYSWGACVVAPRGHAWDTTRYGDTINERAVRILLECILVYLNFF